MEDNFYKDSMVLLDGAIENITSKLNIIRKYKTMKEKRNPIEYITTRIKSEESATNSVPMYISYLENKFSALEANVTINNKNGYILESKV